MISPTLQRTILKPSFHLLKPKTLKPLSCTSHTLPPTPKPQVPLFLKPPLHITTLSQLQTFKSWAQTLSIENGPEPTSLHKEIDWLLEDAIQDDTFKHYLNMGVPENDRELKIRLEMSELYMLWKERIEKRRPFQYIVGCEHWRDMILSVQEGVLIPRPETELIVDMVEEIVKKDEEMREGTWVDLGTGSGAIGIGIGRCLGRKGRVFGTDLSEVAACVARFNVQRYGLQDKVEIRVGSWFEPLEDVKGKIVGLVSNPPYIPSDDILGLQAEVGRHEPKLALDGGENGMDDLLHICEGAALVLKPGGFFMFETNGDKQSKFLVDFMSNQMEGSFKHVKAVSDFAGIQRFVTGFRASNHNKSSVGTQIHYSCSWHMPRSEEENGNDFSLILAIYYYKWR